MSVVLLMYLFAMLVIFPLYYYDHYLNMAFHKWDFFMMATLSMGLLLCIGWVVLKVRALGHCHNAKTTKKRKLSSTDGFAAAYFFSSVITYILCPDGRAAWMGVDGWYMGIVTQVTLLFVYVVCSRICVKEQWIYVFGCAGCTITAVIAILQRVGCDVLHLYYGMEAEVVRDYLSTIGNRTWFSGYYCAVFPIIIYPFLRTEDKRIRIASGGFWALGSTCLLMSYSDSAMAVMAVLLFVVGVTSFRGEKEIKRYLELIVVMIGAWSVMALVYHLFFDNMRVARGISKMLLDLRVILPLLLLTSAGYIRVVLMGKAGKCLCSQDNMRKWRIGLWTAALTGGALLILFIVLNTGGILEKYFGVTVCNPYLFFDDKWGDNRGFAWEITLRMYGELPMVYKLFGVGQDCFAWYAYNKEPYAAILREAWGGAILTNAHNEWLNSLLCSGIFGFISYVGIFCSVIYEYIRRLNRNEEDNIVQGIGLCVIAYMTHNFFCYQQIAAAAPIFILIGIASGKSRDIK